MTGNFFQESERLTRVHNSPIRDLMEKVNEMKTIYSDVITFSAGEPDFPTPDPIKAETIKALERNETHYASSYGIPELRQVIADSLRENSGCSYNPDREIMVTCGAAEGINNVILSLVNPGDEVLLFTPAFITYENLIRMCGGKVVEVPLSPKNGYQIDMKQVKGLTTKKTKAIVLNNPSNPTGVVFDDKVLRELAEWAAKKDLLVISDEIYRDITYDGKTACSMASFPGMKERLILISGFSKTYAMTGWRIGYVAADERFFDALMKYHTYCTTCAPTFLQKGIALGIGRRETRDAVKKMLEIFSMRRRRIMEMLDKCEHLKYIVPYGAFYIMVDVSDTGMDGEAFSHALLDEEHVAVVPAKSMGEGCENMVRLSYACDEENIREGLKRIARFTKSCTSSVK